MPFTLSHVAAILPALRTDGEGVVRGRGPLVAAGLVAGSLAPDVPFFVATLLPRAHRVGMMAHRPAGVLLVDPLLAAALVGGWAAVRAPMVGLLPPRVRGEVARLAGLGVPRRPNPAWFLGSAVVGAATHVGWDAFTHAGRWGVRRLPVLDRRVRGVPLHHWAQYGSSVVGLAVLAGSAARAVRRAPHVPAPDTVPALTTAGRALGAVSLLAAAVGVGTARCVRDRPRGVSRTIGSASFGAGAGLGLGVAAYAGVLRGLRRGRR